MLLRVQVQPRTRRSSRINANGGETTCCISCMPSIVQQLFAELSGKQQ